MKIAFDENVPMLMVKVFQALAQESGVLRAEIVTATTYRPKGEKGDQHWIRRFAEDAGGVVISGDTRIKSREHERAAIVECGMVSYCFERRWSSVNFFSKSAMLLHWWPKVRLHMDTAPKSSFWEIPFQWNWKDLKDVTVDPSRLSKEKPKKNSQEGA